MQKCRGEIPRDSAAIRSGSALERNSLRAKKRAAGFNWSKPSCRWPCGLPAIAGIEERRGERSECNLYPIFRAAHSDQGGIPALKIRGLTWFQYVTDFEGTDCCGQERSSWRTMSIFAERLRAQLLGCKQELAEAKVNEKHCAVTARDCTKRVGEGWRPMGRTRFGTGF
jgi:hypothetical protein